MTIQNVIVAINANLPELKRKFAGAEAFGYTVTSEYRRDAEDEVWVDIIFSEGAVERHRHEIQIPKAATLDRMIDARDGLKAIRADCQTQIDELVAEGTKLNAV
jgi:hypothetical protein